MSGREPIVTEYAFPLLVATHDLSRFWYLAEERISVVRAGGLHVGPHSWPGTDPERPWTVRFRTRCWDAVEGDWIYEPSPSSRTEAFFRRCRFTLDGALAIAAIAAEREGAALVARYTPALEPPEPCPPLCCCDRCGDPNWSREDGDPVHPEVEG